MMNSRCASIFFALTSANQGLNSINDLKKIDFEESVPKHGLLLLHWFANIIEIDQSDDTITLTFDPDTDEYGSHHYGNFEHMLYPQPPGHRYFTVGNLKKDHSHELPDYVHQPPVREFGRDNRDRIIFRVRETNPRVSIIDQVYLTQHFRSQELQGTRYNPEHIYPISTNLLLEIRMFSVQSNHRSLQELRDRFHSNADDSQLRDIRNTWGEELTCLGLLLFIVIKEKYSTNIRQPHKKSESHKPEAEGGGDTLTQAHCKANGASNSSLLVECSSLHVESNEWPHHAEEDGTEEPIAEDHTNHNAGICRPTETHENASADNFDPSIHPSSSALFGTGSEQRHPSSTHADPFPLLYREPKAVTGQLTDAISSVCPTSSPEPPPPQCPPRQAVQGHPEQTPESPKPTPLELEAVTCQLKDAIPSVCPTSSPEPPPPQCPPREAAQGHPEQTPDPPKPTPLDLEDIIIVFVMLFAFLIFAYFSFYLLSCCLSGMVWVGNACKGRGSERPGRVLITGYNAHLELVLKQHKVCARVYVKHFSNWRHEFEHSRVGFYKSADKDTDQYEWGRWQWAKKFESCSASVDYIGSCLEYCSDMEAAPGVQACFLQRQHMQYREMARTPSLYIPDGVKITGYDAHLELFESDTNVCARLYVKESFTQWTPELAHSWVGFYTSPERDTNEYERWQWTTKFKQYESYWEFNVFEYCSDMKATPGAHARLIVSIEKARTRDLH